MAAAGQFEKHQVGRFLIGRHLCFCLDALYWPDIGQHPDPSQPERRAFIWCYIIVSFWPGLGPAFSFGRYLFSMAATLVTKTRSSDPGLALVIWFADDLC